MDGTADQQQQGETPVGGKHWRKTPRERRGFLFAITRPIWVLGVMIALIVAAPVLAPYYAFEKIYGRVIWALDMYTKIKRWAVEKGYFYLVVRVIGLILILLLFILVAPILAPYYFVKRICGRIKWAYKVYPYIYVYLEDIFSPGASRGDGGGSAHASAAGHYKSN